MTVSNNPLPLVSVCCLAYNHAPYIRECLDGFLMQKTTFPIEVLIHDDASTDNTAAIIREYEAKYPDIIKPIYQLENQYSKGVKVGAKYNYSRATGKYIAMCEGDDYWTDPLKLQKQVDFLEDNQEYAAVHTKVRYVDKNNNLIGVSDRVTPDRVTDTFESLVQSNNIHTCSFFFRGSLFRKYPLEELTTRLPAGDIMLFFLAALDGAIFYLNEETAAYRRFVGVSSSFQGYTAITARSDAYMRLLQSLQLSTSQKQALLFALRNVQYCIIKQSISSRDYAAFIKSFVSYHFRYIQTLFFFKIKKIDKRDSPLSVYKRIVRTFLNVLK